MIGLDLSSPPGASEPRLRCAPMVTIRGAVSLLDLNEDKILELLHSRKIGWSFDIGLGRRNSELRLLPASILLYQIGVADRLTWPEISEALIPGLAAAPAGVVVTLSALDVQRALNASCTHVESLMQTKQLRRVSKGRSGPGGSCRIAAESFLKFLQNRRLR